MNMPHLHTLELHADGAITCTGCDMPFRHARYEEARWVKNNDAYNDVCGPLIFRNNEVVVHRDFKVPSRIGQVVNRVKWALG